MTTHTITLARHTAQVVGLMGVLVLGTWDSYGTEQLLLRHGPEWDGLAIDATFHNVPNDEGVTVLADTDGLVPVPPEACMRASKYATITIRGVQDGVQRISCNLPYMVLDHAQVPGANSTATPSENAQALTQMQDLRDGAVDAKKHAEAARDAAAASEKAAASSAVAAAGSAAQAEAQKTAAAKSASDAQGYMQTASDAATAANASAKNAEASAASAESAAKKSADESVAANIAVIEKMQADVASKQTAAAASEKTASDAAAGATDAKAAAVAAQQDAADSAAAAKTSEDAAANSAETAKTAETGAGSSAAAAKNSADQASASAAAAKESQTAAKASQDAASASASTASGKATDAGNSAAAAATSEKNAAASSAAAKTAQSAAETAKTGAESAKTAADNSAKTAASSASTASGAASTATTQAAAAKSSETAAAKSADDAKNYAAQVAGIVTSQAIFGVNFSGSASAGTRVGAAKDFVFTPGTDTSAGQNSFDAVYPWAGMRRCCCTLNADGTVKVNAYKGQPGYIEDGTNGEVLVEIPLFYVSGMLDVAPSISMSMLPGYRAPRKFLNADGSLKQKCYVRAFPGSIGTDSKLHSIAGAVPTGGQNITQFLNSARKWGDTYSVGTSADFEVLAYLMIVVYGTRHAQSKINGCVSLYGTNIAVAAATDNAASVVVAKSAGIEPGMVISIGTGDENETIAKRRIVTSVETIDGDATNVKVNFGGDPVTTTTDHKVWRIMQSTGTANSVIATCGSPVSNTDGRHSFVFYGVENPLYGNQWRFECDWKLIDGVPYWCDDPTKYSWTSNDGYIALDTMAMPDEGWATALQQDDRAPSVQITKSVGGNSGTYLADYFWINKSGTRIALRGGGSGSGGRAGPFSVYLGNDAGAAWWSIGGDLSIPG